MQAKSNINIPSEKIEKFCKKHHIRKLSLFGSALRDDFTPESDLDILVEFDPDHIPGFIRLAGMEIELTEILGRKVDMRTAQDLSRYFREDVLNSAKVQYAEGWFDTPASYAGCRQGSWVILSR
jgi:predicted nucleotidyltransferase